MILKQYPKSWEGWKPPEVKGVKMILFKTEEDAREYFNGKRYCPHCHTRLYYDNPLGIFDRLKETNKIGMKCRNCTGVFILKLAKPIDLLVYQRQNENSNDKKRKD